MTTQNQPDYRFMVRPAVPVARAMATFDGRQWAAAWAESALAERQHVAARYDKCPEVGEAIRQGWLRLADGYGGQGESMDAFLDSYVPIETDTIETLRSRILRASLAYDGTDFYGAPLVDAEPGAIIRPAACSAWIAPDGRFYFVPDCGHSMVAERLFGPGKYVDDLESDGWLHVSFGNIYTNARPSLPALRAVAETAEAYFAGGYGYARKFAASALALIARAAV